MDAGLLPVKLGPRAKTRLGSLLPDDTRDELVRALVDDALDLCAKADFLTWWIVCNDDGVLGRAAAAGIRPIADPGSGLNEALRAGLGAIGAAGATSLTVVAADLPLATREDLQDVLDTGADSPVVIAPGRGGGTNVLYLRPPGAIPFAYGSDSLAAHARAAEAAGLRCTLLPLERLELDLDTPDDVEALALRGGAPGRTGELLARLSR